MRDSLIFTQFIPGQPDGTVAHILAVDSITRRAYVLYTGENTYIKHSEAASALAQIQGWWANADMDRWRRLAGARINDDEYGFLLVLSRTTIVTAAEHDAGQSAPRGQ